MKTVLLLKDDERALYFQEAAARSNKIKLPVIIEKDFWVCFALKHIFSINEINQHITFKGGTSLSKCHQIIDRFSEDCDLTIDKSYLGINEDIKTFANKGRNQKDKSLNILANAAKLKVNNEINALLHVSFSNELNNYFDSHRWRIEPDPTDPDEQTLLFHYPTTITNTSNEYILKSVKLEFGARGDTAPNEQKEITPYLYEIIPVLFDDEPKISVSTLTATRTFWEKATLLHAEHHRNPNKPPKDRMFRHYYDMVMLHKKGITNDALNNISLLETVLINKKNYFASPAANYETAKIGTLKLLPNNLLIDHLRKDCTNMTDMFFGDIPDFYKILSEIETIESIINKS